MQAGYRYTLEPYKGIASRHNCPSCQQRDKTFSLYIDTETDEHLHPDVGRCNRESNCGYHYTPKQYFQDNKILFDASQDKPHRSKAVMPKQKNISFIPIEIFKASLKEYETNHFINFLIELFGPKVAGEAVSRFFIATSKHWKGATVFWQIDRKGKLRTGKIMLYDPSTGKRVKEPHSHINWVHKALKLADFELRQCFFGEHQLIDESKIVAVVESEKTAVIASIYFPQFIWVAVGGSENLNAEKCSVLKGRTVVLFPDIKVFNKWSLKAKELSHIANFTVSDLLEREATKSERLEGFDLADYLIRFNYKDFAEIYHDFDNSPQKINLVEVSNKTISEIEKPKINDTDLLCILEQNRSYSTNEIISLIMNKSGKNKNQSELIFLDLWNEKKITAINDNLFYRSDSTPF